MEVGVMEGARDVGLRVPGAQGRFHAEDGAMFDDDEERADDEVLVTEAEVTCPYCGEDATISVDPGGGEEQDYVEDCPVCCRPWVVHLRWDDSGAVDAWLEASDE